jgi:hypothetical protein
LAECVGSLIGDEQPALVDQRGEPLFRKQLVRFPNLETKGALTIMEKDRPGYLVDDNVRSILYP